MGATFAFKANIWAYGGKASWYFITLPGDIGAEIKGLATGIERRGFGSVRVAVTIGSESWRTSIFPDTQSSSYVLPVKQSVRKACALIDGSDVTCSIELVDF